MNGDYECMVCGYTEHNPISQTCPSCHHTTLSAMTSDADEIDKLESKIARLEEAGDRLCDIADSNSFCCWKKEKFLTSQSDEDGHDEGCAVLAWQRAKDGKK